MPRAIQLSESERKSILDLRKKNCSHRDIAKKINRSKTVVTNFLIDSLKYELGKQTDRRRKVDECTKRHILRTASNTTISCSNIIHDLNLNISRRTINRVIKESNILKRDSPLLTKPHKDLRLKWAKDHMTWNEAWYNVICLDEKKFNLDDPDGFSYYWHDLRKEEEIFSSRPQGGGSVMIWASFGWVGKSPICFVDGQMNSSGYREVLKNHLVDIGSSIGGSNWIFQQNNASVHRSKVNITWSKSQKINVLLWPSLSPNLNPIENVWGLLARKIYSEGTQFRTREQLKIAILKSWEETIIDQLGNLVNSMLQRIFEVIRLNSAKTRY